MYRIGFDVGGTFTDFAVLDERSGAVRHFKLPSTPGDLSRGIAEGLAHLIRSLELDPGLIRFVGHGTTTATNMVIERRGSRTGLLTTRGFRDVLEIGRQTRPHLYDYGIVNPPPLVDRENRIEVAERVAADGSVVEAPSDAELEAAAMRLREAGAAAVAICFLHSYRMPDHEAAARRAVEKVMPEAFVSVSSEVLPEFREFERLSTTVLNAYVGPRMAAYLDRLLGRIRDLGIQIEPYTVHSNGGLMSMRSVRAFPVRTCLSGPAAGVVGAAEVARDAGFPDIITFDVGGTSTDVSLVHQSRPRFTGDRLVADYPVKTPMLDIHVIGAGGGSIARIDDAGALKVGPESAGAEPGPVAYGRGGSEPTITDANLVLGRLDPGALLAGRMQVDARAARKAIRRRIAEPLGLSVEAAAEGIIRIAIANMARAIRTVSTERGHDLGRFSLFAYGGAGPLHAAELARDCAMPRVVVPVEPGTMCARGILLSDLVFDFVRSAVAEADDETWQTALAALNDMMAEGSRLLERDGVGEVDRRWRRMVEARYKGQNHEVRIDLDVLHVPSLPEFIRAFEARHREEYGYDVPGRAVEIVNCRLQAIGRVPTVADAGQESGVCIEAIARGERPVWFRSEGDFLPTPVFDRADLPPGARVEGPAVIEEMSATTLLHPGQSARVDRVGNIIIELGSSGS